VRVSDRQQIAGEQADDQQQNDSDAHDPQYRLVNGRSATVGSSRPPRS
jgi:hypothetical protein